MLSKRELVPIYNFKGILKNLHNHLYGGGPIKTEAKLAAEVAKLVLCKIEDELSADEQCLFSSSEFDLATPMGRELVFNRILHLQKRFNENTQNGFELDKYWIAEVVAALQPYSLLHSKSYVSPLADVYEIFNSGQFKGGRGQFFTPPVVVNLALELLNPTYEDIVIDPACGTGNFLSKVASKFSIPNSPNYIADQNQREEYLKNHLFGRDIEPELVNLTRTYLHLISKSAAENIIIGDSLDLSTDHYRSLPFGKFTKIFTNPPFGNNIQVTNPSILKMYDLGHQLTDGCPTKQLSKGQHPDRLFLELCVKLLQNGGEAAIVLPRQILSGDETNAIELRKWLLRHTTILAVVDLPPDTFQPYTGTITSLLVFRKGASAKDYPIFFAVCEYVGHDRRGFPLYHLDSDGNIIHDKDGLPFLRDDTTKIAEAWNATVISNYSSKQSRPGFLVNSERIKSNPLYPLNAWAYNPDASEAYKRVMELANSDEYKTILPLREICRSIFIPSRHKRKYVPKIDSSVPFLSTTQIFHIHDIDHKYQPLSFASSQGLLVEEGWILVTRSGSTGRVRYVNRELSQCAVSDHCIRIIPDEAYVDGGYLYAFLSSKIGQLLIDQGRYASVIETISHSRLGEIPIPLPDMARQKEIGDLIRKSEDSRVEANLVRQKAIELIEQSLG